MLGCLCKGLKADTPLTLCYDVAVIKCMILTFCYCVATTINPVLTLCHRVTVEAEVLPTLRRDVYPLSLPGI